MTTVARAYAALRQTMLLMLTAAAADAGTLPEVTITASTPAASEVGLVAGEFTVTRTGSTSQALSVTYAITGTASNGGDYTGISNTINIAVGNSSATRAITPAGDNRLEGDETVVLTLSASANYDIGAPSADTVTIADNPATVTIAASDATASEVGLDPGTFTFTRSGGAQNLALTVTYSIGGSASNGGDYTGISNTITIPANDTSVVRTISPAGDNRLEGDETIVLTIIASGDSTNAYLIGAPSADTVTIADNPATVTIAASDAAASEVGLDPGTFTFTRSGGAQNLALTVTYSIGGSASNGGDYTGISNTITIPANDTSVVRTISPAGDNRLEGDETIVLTIIASGDSTNAYLIGAPSADTVTIADNPATVTIAASDAAASEVGLDPGTFTFTRSGGAQNFALTVTYSIGGSASNGGDYTGISNTITIPANDTSVVRTITPAGDNRLEGDETIVLTIIASGDSTNAYLIGAADSDTVTIADNPATVTIAASDAAASEVGLDPGTFTFTRSGGAQNLALTVTYSIGGSASNGGDYTGISNTITIPANQTSVVRTITPAGDANATEGDETVVLTIIASGDSTNAYLIGAPSADTVTITDNAATPTPSLTPSPGPTGTPSPTPIVPTATASPTVGPASADHFMTYALTVTKGTAKLVPLGPLTLADRFRSVGYNVAKLGGLLAPADKNGEGRHDQTTHLLEYRVKAVKGAPKFAKQSDVAVANQCNDVLVQVSKPVSLLVPAAKSLVAPVVKPDPLQHERDHYLCYAAKAQKKRSDGTPLAPLPKRQQVVVEDQFQTRRYDLKKITKLCQPVDKSGSPVLLAGPNAGDPVALEPATIRHPDDYLVCYQAKPATKLVAQTGCAPTNPNDKGTKIVPKQPKHTPIRGIHVATQLGVLQVDTKKELELCIPSTSP